MTEILCIIRNWVGMTCCSVSVDQPNIKIMILMAIASDIKSCADIYIL